MLSLPSRNQRRLGIHVRVRARVRGRAQVPRLNVYRSLNHIYAQVIDDTSGHTLVSASTRDPVVRTTLKTGGNVAAARLVGRVVAERAKAAGISRAVFDRGGYRYHGRVRALAEAAREAGLHF